RIALPSSNSSARRRPRRASRSNARSMSEPMKKASRSPMPKWTPSTSPAMRSIRIGTTQSNPAGSQNRSSYIVMGVLSVPLGLSPNPMAQGDADAHDCRARRQPGKDHSPRLIAFQLPHLFGAVLDVEQEQVPFGSLLKPQTSSPTDRGRRE